MEPLDYSRYFYKIDVDKNKRVSSLTYNLVADSFTGDVNLTDLQIQEGSQTSGTVPNTSEILEAIYFTVDENDFLNTVSNPVKEGIQPKVYKDITNRFFNIVGRGAEVIALPNVLPEEYTQDLVTGAVDITLTAKNDFDLVRISTNDGALIPDRMYKESDAQPLRDHPLNYRYTREFYFGSGKAGDTLKLHARKFEAKLNNTRLPLAQGNLNIDGHTIENSRQRFMMAPYGAFRIRIEFYKEVTETLTWETEYGSQSERVTYLKDTGIGYYGFAEFDQYKRGAKY